MCLNVSKLCLIKSQIYVSKVGKIFGGSVILVYGWSRHYIMGGHNVEGVDII